MKNSRYYKKCITFGRAREGLMADFRQQLTEMQKEIGFQYVRFHGLFHDDMAVYSEKDDSPVLWFGYVDSLFDFLLENNLKPFVELGFMPSQIASKRDTVFWWHANGCPPTDYEKWNFLVRGTVLHFIERYGYDEVSTWYFEVWNEPNLSSFWSGSKEEYFHLYEETVKAIKQLSGDFSVGGPSVSGADFREDLTFFRDFIKFCQERDLPVDFFSAHPYPTYWPLDTSGNEQMGYMGKEKCCEFLDNIRAIVDNSVYSGAEIHLTEWNSSPSPRDYIHDTPFEAPFILYNISKNFGKVDSLAYWAFSDVFEENGPGEQPFHGGFGLINAQGIKKPSYWAYWMLARLGSEIVETTEDYIVAKSDAAYQVIVWNYCYYKDDFAGGDRSRLTLVERDSVFSEKDKRVRLSLPVSGNYTLTEYTLDKNTSAFHNWIAEGAPQYPSQKQVVDLKEKSVPKKSVCKISKFDIDIVLAPHEARMYIIEKAD